MECGDGFLTCCLVVCGFLTHHQQQHFPIVVVVLVCLSRTVHLVGTRFNICRWLAASTYCTICHGAVRLRGNNTPATDSPGRVVSLSFVLGVCIYKVRVRVSSRQSAYLWCFSVQFRYLTSVLHAASDVSKSGRSVGRSRESEMPRATAQCFICWPNGLFE